MAEAERLLRTVLLVALLHSSPWAPPLSLSGLWGRDQQEARCGPGDFDPQFRLKRI